MTAIEVLSWPAWAGAALWLSILFVPWRPWSTREALEAPAAPDATADLSDVTVLIPARDEAAVIGRTLAALRHQGNGLRVIVIDDQSGDDTAARARGSDLDALTVLAGTPPPDGWNGKLWALEQGRARVATPLILLLDADIELAPGMIAALRAKRADGDRAMVSLMAALRMTGFWERLLMPAFVYFFKLLYPFRLANGRAPWMAAAAGGCILIESRALDAIGGFTALRGALIDDCALARRVKGSGRRIWIGLSHGARSHRRYETLGAIWNMVARTAYTQLLYSPALLLLCTALMAVLFWAPVASLVAPGTGFAAPLALGAMAASYLPVLLYYRRSPVWALALPVIGTLFLAMTWTSALRHWRGEGARWKGRRYTARA
jgi:hopene-associated glycosyltransferase HpnB